MITKEGKWEVGRLVLPAFNFFFLLSSCRLWAILAVLLYGTKSNAGLCNSICRMYKTSLDGKLRQNSMGIHRGLEIYLRLLIDSLKIIDRFTHTLDRARSVVLLTTATPMRQSLLFFRFKNQRTYDCTVPKHEKFV